MVLYPQPLLQTPCLFLCVDEDAGEFPWMEGGGGSDDNHVAGDYRWWSMIICGCWSPRLRSQPGDNERILFTEPTSKWRAWLNARQNHQPLPLTYGSPNVETISLRGQIKRSAARLLLLIWCDALICVIYDPRIVDWFALRLCFLKLVFT